MGIKLTNMLWKIMAIDGTYCSIAGFTLLLRAQPGSGGSLGMSACSQMETVCRIEIRNPEANKQSVQLYSSSKKYCYV